MTVVQGDPPRKVLVVEDERALAELYAEFLAPNYAVRTAHSCEQVIEMVDFEPDVVLLDRHLASDSGERVLDALQAAKVDARIAMVTATDPDFDIIPLGIDDYLTKPVDERELEATVERLLALDELDDKKIELSSKRVKRNILEVEKSDDEIAENEEFHRLERKIEALETEIGRLESALSERERALPGVA